MVKLRPGVVRRRAELLYEQLDSLVQIRGQARREMLAESRKHPASKLLGGIPRLGPIRVALLIALLQTPHRFRTKRQLWAYSGLALETRTSRKHWPHRRSTLSFWKFGPVKQRGDLTAATETLGQF